MGQKPKCKSQNYKTLDGTLRVNLNDLRFHNGVLHMTLKGQATKEKIN